MMRQWKEKYESWYRKNVEIGTNKEEESIDSKLSIEYFGKDNRSESKYQSLEF